MRPALKGTIPDKEVVLDVADHPLIFALGLCSGRLAGARDKPIVARQIHKPGMEASRATSWMSEHRRFLVVHQHFGGDACKPLNAADQSVIGVLGVLTVRAPEVESPREAQRVHNEVDSGFGPGNLRPLFGPIALQLVAGRRFKAHRRPTHPQGAFRSDVVPQNRESPRVPLGLELPKDHHRIPDVLR